MANEMKNLRDSIKYGLSPIIELFYDSKRYRWLRKQYGMGKETYLAEDIRSEKELDKYIDEKIKEEDEETNR